MRTLRWNYYIAAIILIALGILTLRYPIEAIMSAGFVIGIGLIVSGINYFSAYYFFGLKRFILLGFLDVFAGAYLAIQPGAAAFIMPFVIGAWLFCTGLSRIGVSLWLGGAKVPYWQLMLINGIALILMAALMCVSPLSVSLSVMIILSCVLIISGILALIEGIILA